MIELQSLCVTRYLKQDDRLISKWFLNGEFFCFGLENAKHQIDQGAYVATRSWSPHFREYLYELSNVQDRKEILIHPANRPSELQGCLAPGLSRAKPGSHLTILHSRKALWALYQVTKGQPLIINVIDFNEVVDQ